VVAALTDRPESAVPAPRIALVVLHIIFAALWFGAPLLSKRALKLAEPQGRGAFLAAAQLGERGGMLVGIGTIGALATGLGLVFYVYGGFGNLTVNFHIALTLLILAMINGFGFLKPLAEKIRVAAEDQAWTPEKTAPLLKKMSAGGGINHLLWLAILILMYWRF